MRVVDATCPLVTKVHQEARKFAAKGYDIVLIGHEGHEEVVGTMGHAPRAAHLVGDEEEAAQVEVADSERVAYLTQTTLSVDETAGVIDTLRERFPVLAGPRSDDICYATQNRQAAVKTLAGECQLVLVIGATNSSNSVRLVEVARAAGCQAHWSRRPRRWTRPGSRASTPSASARAPPPWSGWSTSSSRRCVSGARPRSARSRSCPRTSNSRSRGALRRDAEAVRAGGESPGRAGGPGDRRGGPPVGRWTWRLDGRPAGRRRLRRRGRAGRARCARRLHEKGVAATVLEASDGVGGRVRTDRVDEFLLDRGFQVLLTAYPEARTRSTTGSWSCIPSIRGRWSRPAASW